MALARIKTWISGEVLTSSDLNAEFNNIITNAASLFSPLTAALDCDGFALRLDAAGVTELTSTAAIGLYLTTGAKSGTPGTAGSIANFTTHTFTDSATAGAGTATKYTGFSFPKPTLAAINSGVTTTDAATVYIQGPPTAGANETITNPMALWVDDGISRFDGPVNINGGLDVSNGAFSVSNGAFSVSNGAVNMFKAADIASAATVNLTTATGNLVHITGTTTITAVTLGSGMMRQVIFDGVLTLTHHATNNNLPGAENITTAAGDRALYWADGTTVYCVGYIRANGSVVVPAGATGAQVPQTQEVVGKTGAQSMAGPLTVTGTVTAAPDSLIKNQGAGLPDRGGRLLLEKPVNGTLASNIAVEVGADGVPNRARIGETGGTNRGVFFDLSKAGAGVTSDANFIVAESLGTNGWRKFSDGTIEQWGVAALPASGFGAVNFNLAHTTSVHSVVLTRFHTAQPGTAQGNPTVLNPIGLTSFSAFSGDTEVINYFWNSRGV